MVEQSNPQFCEVTADDISYLIRDKTHLLNALRRRQFLLPATDSCPLLSTEFCQMVLAETAWLPKTYNAHLRNCANPPDKRTLTTEVVRAVLSGAVDGQDMERKSTTCRMIVKKGAPQQFLLLLLASVAPNHEIFESRY